MKGVGGYHLVCDGSSEQAVQRLRQAKRRPHKPFALMLPMPMDDRLAHARALAQMEPLEERTLLDPVRPIVLLRRQAGAPVASAVAPGLADLGLMLPYSPLHYLLLQAFDRPVVATSANISGEPVLTEAEDVERRLGHCCDAYLHHDRPIHRPADDPVVRVIAGRVVPIRLGRGTAPLTLPLPRPLEQPVLACGSQMRTTVALGWQQRAVISPHIGDQGSVRSATVFDRVAGGLQQLHGRPAARLASDAHPGFSTRAWARRTGLAIEDVQHHRAHASSLAAEHEMPGPLLVFAWDGVGLGEDGRLWGGETLYGRVGDWRRIGTFRTLSLVGGDAVAYQPWRSAASVCWALGVAPRATWPEATALRQAWEKKIAVHESSAVGRLFDAAAALLGVSETATYDAQAPSMLESLTRSPRERIALPIAQGAGAEPWIVDWAPLFLALIERRPAAPDGADLVHSSFAGTILDQARRARGSLPFTRVGLTGGVFQNRRLTEEACDLLRSDGFDVMLHERIPPNDGGLSYGQLAEVAARTARESSNA